MTAADDTVRIRPVTDDDDTTQIYQIDLDPQPATFQLIRHHDPTGVSGTGVVACGAQWPDGTVAVRWNTGHRSTVIYDDIGVVEAIHGHQGATTIRWQPSFPQEQALLGLATTRQLIQELATRADIQKYDNQPDQLDLNYRTVDEG